MVVFGVLGNIIENPADAERPLNASDRIPIAEADLRRSEVRGWKDISDKQRGIGGGVNASFLSPLGVSSNLNHKFQKGRQDTLEAAYLKTIHFDPSPKYILQSFHNSPSVLKYINDTNFKKKLYMVIGTKVVYDAKRSKGSSHLNETSVELGATGLPGLAAGPEASLKLEDSRTTSFDASTPFVLAFRLRRIRYSKGKNKLELKDYSKAAKYSLQEDEMDKKIKDEGHDPDTIHIAGIDAEDIGADDLDVEGIEVVDDEDGEICEIVPPLKTS
ncbi:MAG: hypothetical protein Q9227_005012 [Pyrenula ochraceoflavens]